MTAVRPARYPGASTISLLGRRIRGSYDIDEWGLDPELISLGEPLVGLRWEVDVDGADALPATGGALLVWNRRFGASEPWVLGRGIGRASGRFVRTIGVPDIAPIGPMLRRFGGVVDRPDEVAGLLRAGHIVGLPASRELLDPAAVGAVDPGHVGAALEAGVPIFPTALIGREWGRRWRVIVGSPITPSGSRRRPGPEASATAADTTAEAVREALRTMLGDVIPDGPW